uniref:Predicted protein n=1 Tax=Hordeum vulgare subsp. vulgare TaxID=112509 RepID=F2E0Y1_HORVV|nr:predicted protein [Hordeum vulgare subsp. vulgare]
MEGSGMRPCQVKREFAKMDGALRRCTSGGAEKICPAAGQASRRTASNSMDV